MSDQAMTPELNDDLIKLLATLFHQELLLRENITPEEFKNVRLSYFLVWLDNNYELMDMASVCEKAHVDWSVWDYLRKMVLPNTAREEIIQKVWPAILLWNEQHPLHRVRSMCVAMILNYEDGTTVLENSFLSTEFLPGSGFTPGLAVSLILQQALKLVDSLVEDGLQGAYEKHGVMVSEETYNVVMGVLLQIVPQLKPQHQASCQNLMRLAQQVFMWAPPERMKALIAAQKHVMQNRGKALGGWDA